MLHRVGHGSAVQCSRTRPMIINVCGVIDDALIMKFFVFCSAGISFGMLLLLTPTWWNWWMVPSITRQLPSRRGAAAGPPPRHATPPSSRPHRARFFRICSKLSLGICFVSDNERHESKGHAKIISSVSLLHKIRDISEEHYSSQNMMAARSSV